MTTCPFHINSSILQFEQLLLNLARGVFEEQQNLEKLVQKIMLDAQDLLQCERCSVFLIDDPLDSVCIQAISQCYTIQQVTKFIKVIGYKHR